MATAAIVLHPSLPEFSVIKSYYTAAPHEPTATGLLAVDAVAPFGVSFHGLLDTILAKKRTYIVVISHGDAVTGLHLPVAAATDVTINSALKLLLALVDSLDSTGKIADVDALSACANDTALPEKTVLTIAQKCWKIRWANDLAFQVHFRGCEIGANSKHLTDIQALFRSRVVSAPNCAMLYTTVSPIGKPTFAPVKDVVAWGAKTPIDGRRYIYTRPALEGIGPLLLDLHYLGTKSSSQAAVQSTSDIHKWAAIFHQNTATPSFNSFPIAALWPPAGNDYYLPHEDGYLQRIVTVT
ncbi:MAG: hypothetical protein ABUS79_02200 [Pseudomonadota bacterium]